MQRNTALTSDGEAAHLPGTGTGIMKSRMRRRGNERDPSAEPQDDTGQCGVPCSNEMLKNVEFSRAERRVRALRARKCKMQRAKCKMKGRGEETPRS